MRAGNGIRRNELNDTQAIRAIGYERELRCIYAANLHGACVVQRAAGIEHLIDERPLWILNVDNRQALRPIRDIDVSARDIQAACVIEPHRNARDRDRSCRFGEIDNLQPVVISNKSVAELDCDAVRIAQETIRQAAGDARMRRVANVDNVQSVRRRHVEPMPRRSDERRAC